MKGHPNVGTTEPRDRGETLSGEKTTLRSEGMKGRCSHSAKSGKRERIEAGSVDELTVGAAGKRGRKRERPSTEAGVGTRPHAEGAKAEVRAS